MTSRTIQIAGGRLRYDTTVMDFVRWGMSGAVPRFMDTAPGEQYRLLHRVSARPDLIVPFAGRKHHADWCAGINHPDARLIEAAPRLLAALLPIAEHGEISAKVIADAREAVAAAMPVQAATEVHGHE